MVILIGLIVCLIAALIFVGFSWLFKFIIEFMLGIENIWLGMFLYFFLAFFAIFLLCYSLACLGEAICG